MFFEDLAGFARMGEVLCKYQLFSKDQIGSSGNPPLIYHLLARKTLHVPPFEPKICSKIAFDSAVSVLEPTAAMKSYYFSVCQMRHSKCRGKPLSPAAPLIIDSGTLTA